MRSVCFPNPIEDVIKKFTPDGEIWKDIPGYEGVYQISTLGKLRTIKYAKQGRVKNLAVTKILGGNNIQLSKNLQSKTWSMTRVVWVTFFGGGWNDTIRIKRIDGDKWNDRLDKFERK